MILRFLLNSTYVWRSSVNGQKHLAINLKFNSLKGPKLFNISAVSFSIQNNKDIQHLKVLRIWKNITVKELSIAMRINITDLGLLVPELRLKPNDEISSFGILAPAIRALGWTIQIIPKPNKEKQKKKPLSLDIQLPSKPENLIKRPPVVTVMGHVDHGKTTLLDSLRNTFVAQQEFGGITQHIGAFSVEVKPGEKITFIDTPGHAAFNAMRARGAQITDLVVLVIAADDGIMEQTLESIEIARKADVPIVVAVNKIDKTGASSVENIKQKLLWEGVQVEDKGGEIQLVPISALKKINLDLLTEVILLQAELMQLKGDPTGLVEAVIIESKKEAHGIVATLIVKRGTLKKEKIIVAGKAHARVRRMIDENGNDYKEALPSTPVQVFGWKELPTSGDNAFEVQSEKKAKAIIKERERESLMQKQESDKEIIERKALEDKQEYDEMKKKVKQVSVPHDKRIAYHEMNQAFLKKGSMDLDTGPCLKILLKADVFGTLEVLVEIMKSYDKEDECKLTVVKAEVGDVKLGDLDVADLTGAIIYAFNVNLDESANEDLQNKKVEIRHHNVIYKLIDDVKEELTVRIPPVKKEEVKGEAEVLQNFVINHGKKKISVAGSKCLKGQLDKDSNYRILRDGEVIYEGKLEMMKNEKVVVKTINKGMECGLLFESFPDKFKPGDRIICYDIVNASRKSSWDPGF